MLYMYHSSVILPLIVIVVINFPIDLLPALMNLPVVLYPIRLSFIPSSFIPLSFIPLLFNPLSFIKRFVFFRSYIYRIHFIIIINIPVVPHPVIIKSSRHHSFRPVVILPVIFHPVIPSSLIHHQPSRHLSSRPHHPSFIPSSSTVFVLFRSVLFCFLLFSTVRTR